MRQPSYWLSDIGAKCCRLPDVAKAPLAAQDITSTVKPGLSVNIWTISSRPFTVRYYLRGVALDPWIIGCNLALITNITVRSRKR